MDFPIYDPDANYSPSQDSDGSSLAASSVASSPRPAAAPVAATDFHESSPQSTTGVVPEHGTTAAAAAAAASAEQQDSRGSAQKRQADDESILPSLKRQMNVFNSSYLDLLNVDIEDAAHACLLDDDDMDLPHSQIGLTDWTPAEKQTFYDALGRLGKSNIPAIAQRVRTKNELQVYHLIQHLEKALNARITARSHSSLLLTEIPAAIELSAQCCHALEEAADAVSVRQEHYEEQIEQQKWGEYWCVTRAIAQGMDRDDAAAKFAIKWPFADLFHVSRWLNLSERVFMNASFPANNWRYFDQDPPRMWSTAFQDFHSLAVSLTRRIVYATLFVSQSRIKTKQVYDPDTKALVKRQDVEAALANLGLAPNSRKFWAQSARRLRLKVEEEEEEDVCIDNGTHQGAAGSTPAAGEGDDVAPSTHILNYDQVEQRLFRYVSPDSGSATWANNNNNNSNNNMGEPTTNRDFASDDLGDQHTDETDQASLSSDDDLQPDYERVVKSFMAESQDFLHTSADIMATLQPKLMLENTMTQELKDDNEAQLQDARDSILAEGKLWQLLSQQPTTTTTITTTTSTTNTTTTGEKLQTDDPHKDSLRDNNEHGSSSSIPHDQPRRTVLPIGQDWRQNAAELQYWDAGN